MRNLRTPLSEVKGRGSAKEGTSHFWSQRLTAIALIPTVTAAKLPKAAVSFVTIRTSLIERIRQSPGFHSDDWNLFPGACDKLYDVNYVLQRAALRPLVGLNGGRKRGVAIKLL